MVKIKSQFNPPPQFDGPLVDQSGSEIAPEGRVPISASVPIATPSRVCETCHYWVRLNNQRIRTTFGNCIRWQDVLLDDRGGVQASPLTPMTPELASCHEWKDRTAE